MEFMTGRVWYTETHAVIQRDGDATATLSRIEYKAQGMALVDPVRYMSREDALLVMRLETARATR